MKGFPDNVLRIDANKVSSNAEVLIMVCDFIFKEMRQTYHNMTYLKISILVPSRNILMIIFLLNKQTSNRRIYYYYYSFNQIIFYIKILDVVGFIIGIDGKNINKIRDNSGAKIDVFHENINNRYRQIELAGSVTSIANATEQIYRFVNKYYYHNPNQIENEDRGSNKDIRRDSDKNDKVNKSSVQDGRNNYQKNRKERIVIFL